jgi:hypothetical protein
MTVYGYARVNDDHQHALRGQPQSRSQSRGIGSLKRW